MNEKLVVEINKLAQEWRDRIVADDWSKTLPEYIADHFPTLLRLYAAENPGKILDMCEIDHDQAEEIVRAGITDSQFGIEKLSQVEKVCVPDQIAHDMEREKPIRLKATGEGEKGKRELIEKGG